MILTPHIIVGATIGAKTNHLGLIIILGLFSHLILDKIPHWDYINTGIKDFPKNKNFKKLFIDLIKIAIDGIIGLSIVFLIIRQTYQLTNLFFILSGIFFSILPDIILFSAHIIGPRKFSEKYENFHHKFLHYHKNKQKEGKITFLGIITQILVIILSIIIFFS